MKRTNLTYPKNDDNSEGNIFPECNFVFSTSENFSIHLKNLHPNLELREESLAEKGNLKQHIKAIHEKIKNHICKECGYAASQKNMLKKHIEVVHKNIRNHACGDCRYAASRVTN